MNKNQSFVESQRIKKNLWKHHIESWKKSGLSQAEYCRQHNLSHHQLRYWHQKQEQAGQPGIIFAPVPIVKAAKSYDPLKWKSSLRVAVGDRFKVEVADEFSPALLVRLINTLESC